MSLIPELISIGAPHMVLPPGIHDASLESVRARFSNTPRRRALFKGLVQATKALAAAGCRALYIDGSFVTDKPVPGDFDACWDARGVDVGALDPVLLDFENGRARQKAKYGGELFAAEASADGEHTFLDYFQVEKTTGGKKGIIRVTLSRPKMRRKR